MRVGRFTSLHHPRLLAGHVFSRRKIQWGLSVSARKEFSSGYIRLMPRLHIKVGSRLNAKGEIWCPRCKSYKDRLQFNYNAASKHKVVHFCKDCDHAYKRGRYRIPELYKKAQKNWQRPKSRYRIGRNAAKKRNLEYSITFKQYLEVIKLPCGYCGAELPQYGSGMDRKDNNKGYTLENVLPCCGLCNRVKGHWFTFEEMMLLAPIVKEIREARPTISAEHVTMGKIRKKSTESKLLSSVSAPDAFLEDTSKDGLCPSFDEALKPSRHVSNAPSELYVWDY